MESPYYQTGKREYPNLCAHSAQPRWSHAESGNPSDISYWPKPRGQHELSCRAFLLSGLAHFAFRVSHFYRLILWKTLGTGTGSSLIFVSVLFLRSSTNSFSWVPIRLDVPSKFEQDRVSSTFSAWPVMDP